MNPPEAKFATFSSVTPLPFPCSLPPPHQEQKPPPPPTRRFILSRSPNPSASMDLGSTGCVHPTPPTPSPRPRIPEPPETDPASPPPPPPAHSQPTFFLPFNVSPLVGLFCGCGLCTLHDQSAHEKHLLPSDSFCARGNPPSLFTPFLDSFNP